MLLRATVLACITLSAPLSARAATCAATCEFYSTRLDYDLSDPEERVVLVEVVQTNLEKYPKLAKYRRELESAGNNAQDAFDNLQTRCFDTAAARSGEFLTHEPYAPRIIESQSLEAADAEQVCND